MRKIYLTLATALIVVSSMAQTTVGQFDVKTVGWIHVTDYDTLVTGLNSGTAGASVTWDFATLGADFATLDHYKAAQWVATSVDFPDSDIALEQDGDQSNHVFMTHNNIGMYVDGFGGAQGVFKFKNSMQVIEFPVTFNQTWTDTSVIQEVLDIQFQNFDSIEFKQVAIVDAVVDSWGSLTLPIGTYDALRTSKTVQEIDSVWGYTLGQRIYVAAFSGDTTRFEAEWLSNDPDVGGLALRANVAANGDIQDAEFTSAAPGVSINEDLAGFSVKVFPNPAAEVLNITVNNLEVVAAVNLYTVGGQLVLSENITSETNQFDVSSLPNGLYIYKLVGVNGEAVASHKIFIAK